MLLRSLKATLRTSHCDKDGKKGYRSSVLLSEDLQPKPMRKHLILLAALVVLPIGAILTSCDQGDAGTAKIDLQIRGMT